MTEVVSLLDGDYCTWCSTHTALSDFKSQFVSFFGASGDTFDRPTTPVRGFVGLSELSPKVPKNDTNWDYLCLHYTHMIHARHTK